MIWSDQELLQWEGDDEPGHNNIDNNILSSTNAWFRGTEKNLYMVEWKWPKYSGIETLLGKSDFPI